MESIEARLSQLEHEVRSNSPSHSPNSPPSPPAVPPEESFGFGSSQQSPIRPRTQTPPRRPVSPTRARTRSDARYEELSRPRVNTPTATPTHEYKGDFSNGKAIHNALCYTLLAADVRKKDRDAALAQIAQHNEVNVFVVLLTSERNHTFRGLYGLTPDFMHAKKIYGNGPDSITYTDVDALFKYDMGKKSFKQVHTKTFGVTTDAMALFYKKRLWYLASHDEGHDDEVTQPHTE